MGDAQPLQTMKRFTLAAMLARSFAFGCTIPEPRQASSAGQSKSPAVAPAEGVSLEGGRAGPAEPPPSAPAHDTASGREVELAALAGEIAPDADSYTTQETNNAERVLAGMQDDFLA